MNKILSIKPHAVVVALGVWTVLALGAGNLMAQSKQRTADELLDILGLSNKSLNAEAGAASEPTQVDLAAIADEGKRDEAAAAEAQPDAPEEKPAEGEDGEKPVVDPEITSGFMDAVRAASELTAYTREGPLVTLQEALRVTLYQQPIIQLAAEDIAQAESSVKGAGAAFDIIVGAEFGKKEVYQPLTDAEVQRQIAQKRTLNILADSLGKVADGLEAGDEEVKIQFEDAKGRQETIVIPLDINGLTENFGGVNINGQPLGAGLPDPATIEFLKSIGVVPEDVLNPESVSDPAALEAFQKDIIQTQVEAFRLGQETTQQAADDLRITTTERFGTMNYRLGGTKLFRNGIRVQPGVEFNQTSSGANTARGFLEFSVPLLKDRGARMENAFEESAMIDWEASRYRYYHTYSEALLKTVVAFYNTLAAQQNLSLLISTEKINDSFLRLTQLQVREGEKTSGDLAQAIANFGSSRAIRIASEFRLLEARRGLALAMGLDGARLLDAPFAAGVLPTPADVGAVDALPLAGVVALATENRQDLAAAKSLVRSQKVLSEAFRDNMGPNLDFNLGVDAVARNSGTRAEDYFGTLTDRKVGLGAFGTVSLVWPVQDSLAKSQYLSAAATKNIAEIAAFDLERNIQTASVLSLEEVRNTRLQLDAFREALRSSEEALIAEQARFQEGEGSLLDTIQTQNQFTTIAGSVIFSHLSHVSAISLLRFNTGTMISGGSGVPGDESSVDIEEITKVPNASALDGFAGLNSITTTGIPADLLKQMKKAGWELGVDGSLEAPKPLLMRGDNDGPLPLLFRGAKNEQSNSEPIETSGDYGLSPVVGPVGSSNMVNEPAPVELPEETPDLPVANVQPVASEESVPSQSRRPAPLLKRIFGNR